MSAVKTNINNPQHFPLFPPIIHKVSQLKKKANIQTTQKHSFFASKTAADKLGEFSPSLCLFCKNPFLPSSEISMDSAQWTQEFGVARSMSEIIAPNACNRPQPQTERKARPQKDQAINCPRCNSTNTKFCYYNNYSLTQPRYFCKTCRRYWTEGGTLRNVPVGGGSRKNKKSSSSSSSSSSLPLPSYKLPDLNPPSISPFSSQNPKIHDQGQDLNLGFQEGPHDYSHAAPQFLEFPKIESSRDAMNSASSANSSSSTAPLSALNFFRNGIAARGLNSFLPMAPTSLDQNNPIFASFPFQDCKPALLFPIEGSRYDNSNAPHQENGNGSLMFALGATRRDSSVGDQADQDKGHQNSNGYWNGMLGGGSW